MVRRISAMLLATVYSVGVASANLVVNGGFETFTIGKLVTGGTSSGTVSAAIRNSGYDQLTATAALPYYTDDACRPSDVSRTGYLLKFTSGPLNGQTTFVTGDIATNEKTATTISFTPLASLPLAGDTFKLYTAYPTGWSTFGGGWTANPAASRSVDAHSGSYALKIDDYSNQTGLISTPITVTAGKTYVLSYWCKASNTGLKVGVDIKRSPSTVLLLDNRSVTASADTWEYRQIYWTAPENDTIVLSADEIRAVNVPGAVWVQFDDVSFDLKLDYIWVEAEDANVKSGLNASLPQVVSGAGGNPQWNCLAFYDNRGDWLDTATWRNIQLPQPGDYILWVRMKDVSWTLDKFTIKWNDQTIFDNILLTDVNVNELKWFKVGVMPNISSGGNFTFSRGNTMCWMSYLDCFILTTDPDYIPSGTVKPTGAVTWVPERNAVNWIRTDKVKATYTLAPGHGDPAAVMADMGHTGFNSIILAGFRENPQRSTWISAANLNQIKIFGVETFYNICDNPGQLPPYMAAYRKVVYKDGTEGIAPCPLDSSYWNDRVVPGLVATAQLSLQESHVVGTLIDTEMYGVDPIAYLEDACFCDDCFHQFLIAIDQESLFSTITRANRYSWLTSQGLTAFYYAKLEERLKNLIQPLRDNIHMINPDLILGNLNYVDTWFFRGLAKGLGTPSMPAVVAPESPTYTQGYSSFVDTEVQRFRDEGFNVLYVPGIWDIQFFPDDLARNCYRLATHSDGYWDFTIRGFYEGLIPDFYSELMRKSLNCIDEYWDAFAFANTEISNKTAGGSGYNGPLDQDVIDLASGKTVTSTPAVTLGPVSKLTDGSSDYSQTVCWDLGSNDRIIVIVDLGAVTSFTKVSMSFQGGGSPGGLYFPRCMEVYRSNLNLSATDPQWDDPADAAYMGQTSSPDVSFSFPEDGWHSAEAYQRWMTVRVKTSINARYVKLVIYKQPDSYAQGVTKIGETVHRQIVADEIKISQGLVLSNAQASSTVAGTITYDPFDGYPLNNVTIELRNSDASVAETKSVSLTGTEGGKTYNFATVLSGGPYTFAIVKDAQAGWKEAIQSDVIISAEVSVNFTLTHASRGDANIDDKVDVGDLGILAANYGQSNKTWAQGDFNGDGLVDVGDLGILAAHYGLGSAQKMSFSQDYAKVFGMASKDESADAVDTSNSMCGTLGLPLVAGLVLMTTFTTSNRISKET